MDEIWKEIKEAPDCLISNYGNVKVKSRKITDKNSNIRQYKEKYISKNKKKNGYLEVALPIEKNKRIYRLVHRLVLETFNPIENMNKMQVNHKDENKENNNLTNLEWMTSKENCNYGTRNSKVSEGKKVKVQCITTGKIYNSMEEAANDTKCLKSSIWKCCNKIYSQTHGYKWRYYND